MTDAPAPSVARAGLPVGGTPVAGALSSPPRARGGVIVWGGLLLVLALLASACTQGPRPIQVGAEECAHCRMLVSENRFASQLVTDRGRQYVFDSIECMAEFLEEGTQLPQERIGSLWVTDFTDPGSWIPAEKARFLRSEGIRSPMGLNVSAFQDRAAAARYLDEHGGEILTWREVRALAAQVQVHGNGHARSGHASGGGHDGH